jgi:glycosyltransferase involved in cell wall biosynthesis
VKRGKSDRIAVGHVVQGLGIGGLERIVVTLMRGVDRRRFRSSVYCIQTGGEHIGPLRRDGFQTLEFGKAPGIEYSLPIRLGWAFKRDGVDIVHCHNFGSLFYGSLASRIGGSRCVVYTAHGPGFPGRKRQVMFQRLPLIDQVVAVSDHVRSEALNCAGLRPEKVITIVNGVDLSLYRRPSDEAVARKKRDLGLDSAGPIVGSVARLSAEKDHTTLIEAFGRIAREREKARLVIVGGGELLGELEQRVSELGLRGKVLFLGNRSDVPEILPVFDVFALSSVEEGLGITVIEAMASGVPVVGTDAGGIPEIVENGRTGILVPPSTPAELAGALETILENAGLGDRLTSEARKSVEDRYDMQRMIASYEGVYTDVLRRKGVAESMKSDTGSQGDG